MATAQVSLLPEARPAHSEINISQVVFRADLYPRSDHDPVLVQRYKEVLDLLPPIEINQDYILVDGRHRLLAHQAAGRPTIKAKIIETKSEAEIFQRSVESNSTHGYQLSPRDKQRIALRYYDEKVPRSEIARRLAVQLSTLSYWFTDKDKLARKERKQRILDLWLACDTTEEIAEKIGTSHQPIKDVIEELRDDNSNLKLNPKVTFSEEGWVRPEFNVWRFKECSNEVTIFGQSEQHIVENLMCLYTAPLDIVVDVMSGGGSTIDVCKKRMRRYWASDLNPILERSGQIRKMDAVKEIPPLHNRWSDVSLTYLDPPYWKQAEGQYSHDPEDLGNMTLEDFNDSLTGVIRRISEKQSKGVIALLISPTQYAAPDRQFTDHVFDICKRAEKMKKLKLENRVSCPYTSQIYQNKLACVNWAKENRKLLSLSRELIIWKIQS